MLFIAGFIGFIGGSYYFYRARSRRNLKSTMIEIPINSQTGNYGNTANTANTANTGNTGNNGIVNFNVAT